jgi:hypothetical protein
MSFSGADYSKSSQAAFRPTPPSTIQLPCRVGGPVSVLLLTPLFIQELAHHPEYLLAHGFPVLDPICQTQADAATEVTLTPVHRVQPAAPPPAAWTDKPRSPPACRHYRASEVNWDCEG